MFLEAVGNVFPNGHTSEALSRTKKGLLEGGRSFAATSLFF